MTEGARRAVWRGSYLLVAGGPLLLALVQLDPGRGFWVNLSVAMGFVGLAVLGGQFLLAARWTRLTAPLGVDTVLQWHKQITALAVVLVVGHPLILFVWDRRFLALLDVTTAPARARLAVASVVLLLVLIATSVWRRKLRLGYPAWQLLHLLLGTAIVVTALLHVLLIGYYVDQPWERAVWVLYTAAFVWIAFWVRVVKPLQRWRRRWRVVDVRHESGGCTTVRLELADPGSYGPEGFRFTAGQFAWIHTGFSPFAVTYHPFSFSSSSADGSCVEFTIKAVGDFTRAVQDLPVGRQVFLDGPYGDFGIERYEGPGYVFLATGVGVTPMISMLSTMADRGERRPCWLFVGDRDRSSLVRAEDLDTLTERLDLTVVHVLSGDREAVATAAAHGSRSGRTAYESGRIDRALLDRRLPPDRADWQYFLCGGVPMMDAVEAALIDLGVPADRIHAERFVMV